MSWMEHPCEVSPEQIDVLYLTVIFLVDTMDIIRTEMDRPSCTTSMKARRHLWRRPTAKSLRAALHPRLRRDQIHQRSSCWWKRSQIADLGERRWKSQKRKKPLFPSPWRLTRRTLSGLPRTKNPVASHPGFGFVSGVRVLGGLGEQLLLFIPSWH